MQDLSNSAPVQTINRFMPNQYFTTSQAAKILHVTRFTVLNWIKSGKLKAVATLGGHQRIPKRSLEAFLDQDQSLGQAPLAEAGIQAQKADHEAPKSGVSQRAALAARKANISRMLKRSAFVSGKYIASFKNEVSHILA
ncbi:MAG: helix-turn-helix domain-containing protein [Candidatus Omnitrophica bacterium]|nr:helix-turn-helix domain-containing protein [Candidatus Omnitrophota bacterium]